MTLRESGGPGNPHARELEVHDEWARALADLETCLAGAPDARWVARMRKCMNNVSATLRDRFRIEEDGGMYRDLAIRKPRLSNRIAELRAEHDQILEGLEGVVETVKTLDPAGQGAAAGVRDRARVLIAELERHENRETALLHSAFWREVGAGG